MQFNILRHIDLQAVLFSSKCAGGGETDEELAITFRLHVSRMTIQIYIQIQMVGNCISATLSFHMSDVIEYKCKLKQAA